MKKIEMGKKYRTASGSDVRILCVNLTNNCYPVAVEVFDKGETVSSLSSYTSYGEKWSDGHDQHLKLVEVLPYEDFKDGDPVVVSNQEDFYHSFRRHFKGMSTTGLNVVCHDLGVTKWSCETNVWKYCRKPTTEELA